MLYVAFRNYKRIDYTTPNQVVTIDPSGSVAMVEVTVPSTAPADVNFFPNPDLPVDYGGGITVYKGTTRQIPMRVYTFKADGNCTVIAYKQ